jgi:hypothetical protein
MLMMPSLLAVECRSYAKDIMTILRLEDNYTLPRRVWISFTKVS